MGATIEIAALLAAVYSWCWVLSVLSRTFILNTHSAVQGMLCLLVSLMVAGAVFFLVKWILHKLNGSNPRW